MELGKRGGKQRRGAPCWLKGSKFDVGPQNDPHSERDEYAQGKKRSHTERPKKTGPTSCHKKKEPKQKKQKKGGLKRVGTGG